MIKSINNRRRSYYYRPDTPEHLLEDTDVVYAYIDSAYHYELDKFSYAIILTNHEDTIIEKFYGSSRSKKYLSSKGIAGEVFGALYAIKYAIQKGFKKVVIHYKYEGLEQWATLDWNRNKPISMDYQSSLFHYSKDIYISVKKGNHKHNLHANHLAYIGLDKEFAKSGNIKEVERNGKHA